MVSKYAAQYRYKKTSLKYKASQKVYMKKYSKKHYKKNKEKYRRTAALTRLRKFGLDPEGYNRLFEKQNGCCGCCGRHQSQFKRGLAVDHDHTTNLIRGLLCFDCNTGLGKLGDNLDGLNKAVHYLETCYEDK